MKYSKQRNSILNVIETSYEHPTAEMIYEIVKKEIPNISLGTVYRNLNQLVEANIIRKIVMPDGIDRFDRKDAHDHMRCLHCLKIVDIYHPELQKLDDFFTQETKHHILSHEIIFTGICKDCIQKERRNENGTKGF